MWHYRLLLKWVKTSSKYGKRWTKEIATARTRSSKKQRREDLLKAFLERPISTIVRMICQCKRNNLPSISWTNYHSKINFSILTKYYSPYFWMWIRCFENQRVYMHMTLSFLCQLISIKCLFVRIHVTNIIVLNVIR